MDMRIGPDARQQRGAWDRLAPSGDQRRERGDDTVSRIDWHQPISQREAGGVDGVLAESALHFHPYSPTFSPSRPVPAPTRGETPHRKEPP
jgi:hypothetical protein